MTNCDQFCNQQSYHSLGKCYLEISEFVKAKIEILYSSLNIYERERNRNRPFSKMDEIGPNFDKTFNETLWSKVNDL
jgi:hypothetical protein